MISALIGSVIMSAVTIAMLLAVDVTDKALLRVGKYPLTSKERQILIDAGFNAIEIENINQLKQVMGLKFKRILFDNMKTSQIKKCLKICKNRYQTEYSGNASLKNIKQISKTGINRISVGTITHSAKSFDTTLLFR